MIPCEVIHGLSIKHPRLLEITVRVVWFKPLHRSPYCLCTQSRSLAKTKGLDTIRMVSWVRALIVTIRMVISVVIIDSCPVRAVDLHCVVVSA